MPRLATPRGCIGSSARIPLAILLVVAVGCSKSKPTQPPDSGERHGTPLVDAGTIDPSVGILWSQETNEVIAVGSFGSGRSGALLAIASEGNTIRTLDSTISIPEALGPDGSAVYYMTIEDGLEDIAARRVPLDTSAPSRTLRSCSGLCVHVLMPAPDGEQVAIGTNGDSLVIIDLGTGFSRALTDGHPMAFSPDGSQLLVGEFFEGLRSARILTVASGTSGPANLGLPDTLVGAHVRWTDAGLEFLFVSSDRRHLLRRNATTGITTPIWASADTLKGPIAWSPSAGRAALWSSHSIDATRRRWELHGIELAIGAHRLLAYGVEDRSLRQYSERVPRLNRDGAIFPPPVPSGLAFAPDESGVAYSWLDGRLYRVGWTSVISPIP